MNGRKVQATAPDPAQWLIAQSRSMSCEPRSRSTPAGAREYSSSSALALVIRRMRIRGRGPSEPTLESSSRDGDQDCCEEEQERSKLGLTLLFELRCPEEDPTGVEERNSKDRDHRVEHPSKQCRTLVAHGHTMDPPGARTATYLPNSNRPAPAARSWVGPPRPESIPTR